MNSVLVALFALFASSFRARAALQAEILALRHQLAVLHKNARLACACNAPTDGCGSCCHAAGRVGAPACRSCSPTPSSAGTGKPLPGIGPANRGSAAREDLAQTAAIDFFTVPTATFR